MSRKFYPILLLTLLTAALLLVSCGDGGSVNLPVPTETPGGPTATVVPNPTPGNSTSTISGTVYGADGIPVDGMTVRLTPLNGPAGSEAYGEVQTFTTSNSGQYSFSVLYAGVYLLEALNGETLLDSQQCNVTLGTNVNVILGTPSNVGSLKVKVTEDGSTPIEGAVISLTEALETSDYLEASYYYSEGWYIFEDLALKDYILTVNVSGYETYTDTVNIGVTSPTAEKVVTLTALSAPTITGFSPSIASAGIIVTIEGSNFSSEYTENIISFNGTEGTVILFSPTEIRVAVPEGATTGPVYVTTPGGTVLSDSDLVILEMVLIESGTYPAGSDNYTEGTAVDAFYTGKYEVTNAEYEMYDSNHTPYSSWAGDPNVSDYPVERVNWNNACNYCNWLSEQSGLTPVYDPHNSYAIDNNANGYRLPYAIEWEYACRAGTRTDFFWGEDYPLPVPSRVDQYCWYNGNSANQPHEVYSLNPNGFGLFHMSGNVLEWCNDTGHFPSSKTLRGGTADYDIERAKSSFLDCELDTNSFEFLGFRLCRNYD